MSDQETVREPGAPHVSVLLDEVVGALASGPGDVVVDGTFGAGGYTRAILATGASVIAFDRDPSVARFAAEFAATANSSATDSRFRLIQDRFSQITEYLEDASVDGVTLDLGVSSMQLDEAERGFSFMRDGPLDMRMGADGPTAADLVNELDQVELARILYVYGEEHASRRIASFIVKRRAERPFTRTLDLAHVIERALGGRKGAKVHPATRSFQGLRIAVNAELEELEAGLVAAERVLKPGGRLAVVTFHSLEDRIVKNFLAERAGRTPGGSRHAPPVEAGAPPSFQLISSKAIAPGEAELAVNPRARSSKLRAAVRTQAPVWSAA
ncbi:ribosomal RNA small subunit methyltransferase H [Caulobacter sp. Root487D2Y]|uniref:16S rRNA (cytosine(1402)-N(4))-methyltransferase RsmH n=1 Tax=Caulobacter sp. Root487D2Y TaxID=1736547 RepID=UPI000701FC6E|nr:16S rRNA (cytosine(1402)-N(4))-methyltransferase RsmH [Caulobacter sp. Root487D2Y]KQY34356.1 ribosomal RNA small subunit methyltransferase H [Caulobacter sp. Root487D2Y]